MRVREALSLWSRINEAQAAANAAVKTAWNQLGDDIAPHAENDASHVPFPLTEQGRTYSKSELALFKAEAEVSALLQALRDTRIRIRRASMGTEQQS